ncbi:MAG: sulfotransferase domain-containing protein [Neomegalonema sp.]|nr:sulfotransferase domain-containing protein [Neomegalonema sp.]
MDFQSGAPTIDFVIAGVMKGGTTALWHILRERPDIQVAGRKELNHWLGLGARIPFGLSRLAYKARFPRRIAGKLRGEASPDYLYHPTAIDALKRCNGSLRVIIMLRDPVSRAYAHWNHYNEKGRDARRFAEAVRDEMSGACDTAYLARSRYAGQCSHLLSHFAAEQVLFLKSEEARQQPQDAWLQTARFLGVAPEPAPQRYRFHQRSYPEPIDSQLRAQLVAHFEPDIAAVEALTGWDVSDWRDMASPEIPLGR